MLSEERSINVRHRKFQTSYDMPVNPDFGEKKQNQNGRSYV